MDTNKENELLKGLTQSVPSGTAPYRADGIPLKPGVPNMAVNPPVQTGGNASSQAEQPQTANLRPMSDSAVDVSRVTPEMVNRMEMYGTEAIFDAREDN